MLANFTNETGTPCGSETLSNARDALLLICSAFAVCYHFNAIRFIFPLRRIPPIMICISSLFATMFCSFSILTNFAGGSEGLTLTFAALSGLALTVCEIIVVSLWRHILKSIKSMQKSSSHRMVLGISREYWLVIFINTATIVGLLLAYLFGVQGAPQAAIVALCSVIVGVTICTLFFAAQFVLALDKMSKTASKSQVSSTRTGNKKDKNKMKLTLRSAANCAMAVSLNAIVIVIGVALAQSASDPCGESSVQIIASLIVVGGVLGSSVTVLSLVLSPAVAQYRAKARRRSTLTKSNGSASLAGSSTGSRRVRSSTSESNVGSVSGSSAESNSESEAGSITSQGAGHAGEGPKTESKGRNKTRSDDLDLDDGDVVSEVFFSNSPSYLATMHVMDVAADVGVAYSLFAAGDDDQAWTVVGLIMVPCAMQLLGDVVGVRGRKSSASGSLAELAVLTLMNITQTRILYEAWKCTKLKKETGAFNGVRTIYALLGSFPQAILQTSILIRTIATSEARVGQKDENEALLLLLSVVFSVVSVGRAVTSFEFAFSAITEGSEANLRLIAGVNVYFLTDVALRCCSLGFAYATGWGNILLLMQYLSRTALLGTIYLLRGWIYPPAPASPESDQQGTTSPKRDPVCKLVLFSFLVAGLIQTLAGDLPFNNEAAKYLWSFLLLTFLSTIEPTISILVGAFEGENAVPPALTQQIGILLATVWFVKMVCYVRVYFPMKQADYKPKVNDANACAMED